MARTILTGVLAGQAELLADLRAAGGSGDDASVEAPEDVAVEAGDKAGDEAADKNHGGSGG